ncbi:MAG: DUF1592 domain-containing protein [Phycisphaerales bacterium]|nr:DUF1592 domain-containing protein [Phycisphaerales bacterium]
MARTLLQSLAALLGTSTTAFGISVSEPPDLPSQEEAQTLLATYCLGCHGPERMKAGIRLDQFGATLDDEDLFLIEETLEKLRSGEMPPEDAPQPTNEQRRALEDWARSQLANAERAANTRHGTIRRLTVGQYRNTLRDLLGLEDQVTGILPPDAISRDGFTNNSSAMTLSPLLMETYFEIAEEALDRCIVDESATPVIQNFRVRLGRNVNPEPYEGKLILGAGSNLLPNADVEVVELEPEKPYDYEPFRMQRKFRFIEGYRGNDTVRGWRDFDSIYHAVFADLRGTGGYPKGRGYQTVPGSLLLRPAIPSSEIFGQASTYGPRANFKVAVRELPDYGQFRISVVASKYDDGLLLDSGASAMNPSGESSALTVMEPATMKSIEIPTAGIYQVDVHLADPAPLDIPSDASRLGDALIGYWPLDDEMAAAPSPHEPGALAGDAAFVESPFGKALKTEGDGDALVVSRHPEMNVGTGPFTVSAWIRPEDFRQGGIVSLGGYGWTHGWLLDMPDNKGVLRIETADSMGMPNGTVSSKPGALRKNAWQHVAAVVERGENRTRLYVNGYEVGTGTIKDWNLDNPKTNLHIGRVQDAASFPGQVDEARIYRRALGESEIQALLDDGRQFVKPPPKPKPQPLDLVLGDREFSGTLKQPAFVVVRLPEGPLDVTAKLGGPTPPERVVFTRLEDDDPLADRFNAFEARNPILTTHLGFRRDCGSTLPMVEEPRAVTSDEPTTFVFEGAIRDHPSPDVEKNNVNYLAGFREIGIRSGYTDGRDMPRLAIHSVEFEGPLHDTWPPSTHQNIFIDSDSPDDPETYAREIIRSFGTRAFRRPITAEEEEAIFAVWNRAHASGARFNQAIKDALLVVLTSPQFLFIIEESQSPDIETLGQYELASKLSYFLWNTGPDQRLLELASGGNLHDELDTEIDRLIDDPKFGQFIEQFTAQWLDLARFDTVETNAKRFPDLTRDTKVELRREPIEFMRYLVDRNLSVRNLIRSDFIVANETVAAYYGIPEATESGFEFKAIRHENEHLGGLLSQASILAGLSDGQEPNPVKRGAWFARKIIAEPPDDPPPNVPELGEDTTHLPLRERLALHRNQAGCVKCHEGIDPWGLPFEEFDAGGRFMRGTTPDAGSTLPDGTEVANLNDLREYLVAVRLDQVAFSFMRHLAAYAVGRDLGYAEVEHIRQEGRKLRENGYRMRDMIRFVINSDLFIGK